MLYTPISPPRAATVRFRPDTPAHLAERRRQRLERLVAQFERPDIEAAVDGLIALLDDLDGDPDREANGDELDGSPSHEETADLGACANEGGPGCIVSDAPEADGDEQDHNGSEDDFIAHHSDGRPGCPIADPDHGPEEMGMSGGGDPSWTEWHTRGRHKVGAHGAEIVGRDRHGNMLHEDAEDDDQDTGVEDGAFDPEEDKGIDDERHDGEDLDEPDDRESRAARRPHRDRIRRTRCDRIVYPANRYTGRQTVEYRLRDGVTRIGGVRIVGL